MGFFKKLFKYSSKKEDLKPDNTRLFTLIEQRNPKGFAKQ